MPPACMRRPAASSQINKDTIMRRPCANGVMRRPAVYIMPILVKKGQSRMTTRGKQGSGQRRNYTRIAKSKFDRSRVHLTGMHTVTKLQGAKSIRRMLTSKGLLPVRKLCSKCGSRVRQDVYEPRCGDYGYRCSYGSCAARFSRFQGHPLFHISRRGLALAQQVMIVSAVINATSLVNIHAQTGISHCGVEAMAKSIRLHLQKWVPSLGAYRIRIISN